MADIGDGAGEPIGAMNWKLTAGIALLMAGVLVGGILVFKKARSSRAVTVTLRVAVSPADQAALVEGQAKSARFKYLMGKYAGIKPVLAQKLSVNLAPTSALVEAQISVPTRDEGRRYAEGFVETLQVLCGRQARLALAEQTVR